MLHENSMNIWSLLVNLNTYEIRIIIDTLEFKRIEQNRDCLIEQWYEFSSKDS